MDSEQNKPLFYNWTPIVGWIFIGWWLSSLMIFSYMFVRDGGLRQLDYEIEAGILILFWVFGLTGIGHLFSQPVVKIFKAQNNLIIKMNWLLKSRIFELSANNALSPFIETKLDSDGDTFSCLITLPDGMKICFATHNLMEDAQSDCKKFIDAIKAA